ncbi:MAG: hypothetical protein IJU48_02960 [Synergistaceae bacterium]|nr:hypothetical protein [Synergistaceae bacterium]
MFDFFGESYYEYYYSPTSTRNSKIIAFVFSFPFLILLGSDFWNLINQLLTLYLGANEINAALTWIICLVVLGLLVLLRKFIAQVIHDMAFVETYHRNKPGLKGDLCLLSAIFISMGLVLSSLAFLVFPRDYEFFDLTPFEEITPGKIYYVEDLEIWFAYAENRTKDNEYYISAFINKDYDYCIMPFDAGGSLKLLDKLDDRTRIHVISCYVRFSKLDGNLPEFFNHTINARSWLKKYRIYSKLNAEYICAENENFMLHAITNREILRAVMSLLLIFTGIYALKEAFIGIYKTNKKKLPRLPNRNFIDKGEYLSGVFKDEDLMNDIQELIDEFNGLIEEFDDDDNEENEDNENEENYDADDEANDDI